MVVPGRTLLEHGLAIQPNLDVRQRVVGPTLVGDVLLKSRRASSSRICRGGDFMK